jgi:drug/metabolite transporter, DME family
VTSSTTSPPTAHSWRGLISVSLAGVIWGTIGPGVQLVHQGSGLSPWIISAYRSLVAVAVLVIGLLVSGRPGTSWTLARAQWRRVTVVGVLTAAFQLQFFVAVVETGVSVATVVGLGSPPLVLLILHIIRGGRAANGGRLLSIALAVVGLVLVSLAGDTGDHLRNPTLGILAALGSGIAYAFSADVAAPLSQRLDTLTLTTATMTVAAAALTPLGLTVAYLRDEPLTTTDPSSWLLIAYLGTVTMAVAYALLYVGLRTTSSGAAVVATLLEPVTAVLVAVLFLGDHLTGARLLGSLLILTAIATMRRESQEPQPQ